MAATTSSIAYPSATKLALETGERLHVLKRELDEDCPAEVVRLAEPRGADDRVLGEPIVRRDLEGIPNLVVETLHAVAVDRSLAAGRRGPTLHDGHLADLLILLPVEEEVGCTGLRWHLALGVEKRQ
jgi:hypothetical protein